MWSTQKAGGRLAAYFRTIQASPLRVDILQAGKAAGQSRRMGAPSIGWDFLVHNRLSERLSNDVAIEGGSGMGCVAAIRLSLVQREHLSCLPSIRVPY